MDRTELNEAFVDNIATLPIEPIMIATPKGPTQVDALILGDWALNQNKDGWTVTHRKSGYGGKSYTTPIEALIAFGIVLGSGLRLPDNFQLGAFADIPDIRNIGARIKSALVILESFELDLDYNEPEYEEYNPGYAPTPDADF